MTREEAKQLLPVIKAFAEGEEIQYRNYFDEWIDIKTGRLSFIKHPSYYRIKPQPNHRPSKSQEERLVAQIAALKYLAEEYPGKTIENIIAQLEARKKEVENAY